MLKFIVLVAVIEAALIVLITYFRKEFQWLITQEDENPVLDQEGLKKFFSHGYDSHLGWVRKPNTNGVERGVNGNVTYKIDESAARYNPLSVTQEPVVAAFGDSYVFCRQVNDDETWPVFLSEKLNKGVINFGVGNYGADQSLLRYEAKELPGSIKVVILGIVPETICRVQSYWKHYLEFGNTFAFKPRFKFVNEELTLVPNVMQSQEDFLRLKDKLKNIQENDGFYKSKFKSVQFRFPYIFSYVRHIQRNTALLVYLIIRFLARRLDRSTPKIENAPFKLIMESNIKESHRMYLKPEATKLLKAVFLRFKEDAIKRGHTPIVLVMPQLIDLKLSQGKVLPYADFYKELNQEVTTLDMTEYLLSKLYQDMYVEDSFGGHFSKKGNEMIADYLLSALKRLPECQAVNV